MSAPVLNERTENMIADFADDIIFQNVMNGEKTMELLGIEEFKKQAIEALSYLATGNKSLSQLLITIILPISQLPLLKGIVKNTNT